MAREIPLALTEKGAIEHIDRSPRPKSNYAYLIAAKLFLPSFFLIWLSLSAVPRQFWSNRSSIQHIPHGIFHDDNVAFENIIPSRKLEWHQCYDTFYCARLTVPMDYTRPLTDSENNPKVHIALILAPGVHKGHQNFSESPVLLNPGGPGGSGTMFAMVAAGMLQKMIDPTQDMIGFDPRGIGATTPRADCFSYPLGMSGDGFSDEDYLSGNYHRMLWRVAGLNTGLANSSSDALLKLHSEAMSMSKLCREKDDLYGENSIFKHINTPNVARDMISIIDAWDEWTSSLSKVSAPSQKREKDVQTKLEKSEVISTKPKLSYLGFSYGTLLGATFAAMFPDRVGRIVLDGVVDADHYVTPMWANSIQDTQGVFDTFSKFCFEAASKCALYRPSDTSAKDIADRYQLIMENLKTNPPSLVNQRTKMPVVITHSTVKMVTFLMLYLPNLTFPLLALMADLLDRGQAALLAELFQIPEPSDLCGPKAPPYTFPNEAQSAIMCSDKRYPMNYTLPTLQREFEGLSRVSPWADVWMSLMIHCNSWPIKVVDPPMPWGDHSAHTIAPINTSFPLLFISNSLDPVTPLSAGLNMTKKFAGAGLIEQQSGGHCSIAAVSICTILKLRAYFREGIVPSPPTEDSWEKCSADEWPWHPFNGTVQQVSEAGIEVDVQEVKMAAQAAKELQNAFRNIDFFGTNQLALQHLEKAYSRL